MTRRKPKLSNTPSWNYEGLKQNCSSKSSRPEAFQLGWSQNNHCTDWRNKSSVLEYPCLWNFIYWSCGIRNVCDQIVAGKRIPYNPDLRDYILHWIICKLQATWELCFCEFTFLTVLRDRWGIYAIHLSWEIWEVHTFMSFYKHFNFQIDLQFHKISRSHWSFCILKNLGL